MGTSLVERDQQLAGQMQLGLEGPTMAANLASGATQHLLARRSVLNDAIKPTAPVGATVLLRNPPIPAALLLLARKKTRERFKSLLRMANLEVDVCNYASDALEQLASRVHALMFTDDLDLIRGARQLPSGVATHIVFVGDSDEAIESDALRAGANDCMPADARGEHFWAHLTIARRIADLAASLQLALRDNHLLSTVDELTQAGRRGFFEEQFPREVERAIRMRRPLALVMCDIDHFKLVNDRYGHQVGDAVLKEFTSRISSNLRLGKDWIARLGGEEFAVVFPDTPAREASLVAGRLRERIDSALFNVLPQQVSVTASFGVCALEHPSGLALQDLTRSMMREADAALYQSKHRGRNQVTACNISTSDALHADLV
jgi:two-component system, cell cycle response regulator